MRRKLSLPATCDPRQTKAAGAASAKAPPACPKAACAWGMMVSVVDGTRWVAKTRDCQLTLTTGG